jgi:prolyl 4-hydroxylase
MRDAASHSRERFVGNPLNSFLLIKKLTSEWKEVQGLIQSGPGERLLHNITLERQNIGLRWPSDEDLNGAAVGEISQLQRRAPRLFFTLSRS